MHIQSSFRAIADHSTHPGAGGRLPSLLGGMQPAAVTFYPADGLIYAQGDAVGPLYYVEFGTVRICKVTADGRRQISAFHVAGDVFGFEAEDEHSAYAESVDGVGLRVLRQSGQDAPTASLLQLAIKSLSRVQTHLLVLGRRNANERMAALLVDLMERQGGSGQIHLAMPRNDIADYLGITFETVSRVLRCFKEQGLITLRSVNEIEVLDVARLEDLCD